jgi:DNA-binding winged helix-turn-helix (wHTH) protein
MAVSSGKIYEFREWRLDPAEHLLSRSGSHVSLGPKVFDTLLVLVENAGRLVTKDEFMKRVWPDTIVEDLALTQNISQLRKILGNAEEPVIETVPKRGYRLLVSVTVRERTQSQDSAAHCESAGAASRTPLRRVVYYLGLAAVVGALVVTVLIVASRNRPSLRASNFVQITNDGQAKQGPIVSDGLRLYFREGSSNHYILAQAAVSGGEATALPTPLQAPYILDMAPNRSELFVGSSGPETSTSATPRESGSIPIWIFSKQFDPPASRESSGLSSQIGRPNLRSIAGTKRRCRSRGSSTRLRLRRRAPRSLVDTPRPFLRSQRGPVRRTGMCRL